MNWRLLSTLGVALLCAGCAAASTAAEAPRSSVDARIPTLDTPLAGVSTGGTPIDTSGITAVDISIVHNASGYPPLRVSLTDSATLAQFVGDVHTRTLGGPAPGTDSRYACPMGATATYTVDVHQAQGGYTLTEQICNGGLLSGALSGDVRGFLGDLDGFAHTE